MPFTHEPHLMVERQSTRILRVTAIDAINEAAHLLFRGAQNGDCAIGLDIYLGHLLTRAQVVDCLGTRLGRNPERDAAARPATVQPEYEARFFRSTTVHEGVDTQGAMQADQARGRALYEIETGPPHQRAITKDPEVASGMFEYRFHDAPAHNKTPTQLQGIAR